MARRGHTASTAEDTLSVSGLNYATTRRKTGMHNPPKRAKRNNNRGGPSYRKSNVDLFLFSMEKFFRFGGCYRAW